MKKAVIVAVLVLLSGMAAMVPGLGAEEQHYELRSSATVKDVLMEQTGKHVIVRLEDGESVEGTVGRVGESVVHITKLSGRDFYDAVVRIDRISAVIFKVRGK